MRTLLIGGVAGVLVAIGALVVSFAAFGGSTASPTSEQALQRRADYWQIDKLEKDFHRATSRKDIDLMMGLWAPNATFTVGPGQTATGKGQIRRSWLDKSKLFQPTTNWISETPAYKTRITVNGDRGTLYFECHYIDLVTQKLVIVTAADVEVARIDGRWLITSLVGGTATLST